MPAREYLSKNLKPDTIHKFCKKLRQAQETETINPDLLPEMTYISLFSAIFIPILAQKVWPVAWGFEIEDDKLVKHVSSFTLNGVFGNVPKKEKLSQDKISTPDKTPENDKTPTHAAAPIKTKTPKSSKAPKNTKEKPPQG
jgi:hypothetical protein